jgi:hypothetical protein
MSGISLIFMTHKPRVALEEVWRWLDFDWKAFVVSN